MEYERKQKIKKGVLIGYISITTIFTIFMIIMLAIAGVSSKKKQKASAYVQDSYYVSETYKSKIQPKYVSYNDESYTITLNADELNNYNWVNFNTYLSTNPNLQYSEFTIGDDVYEYDGSIENNEYEGNNYYYVCYVLNDNFIYFNLGYDESFVYNTPNKFSWFYGEDIVDFDTDVEFNLPSSIYNDVKSAIELDIQANEKSINDGIFETLTDSVVAFIGSISSGITAMTSVFYDSANSQLTTIGLLSVIVVAVSLTYFLFRLIIGLIRMRG